MNDLRLSAYYYSFEPTGIPEIDNILSAVAWAGKSFHHTDGWTDETDTPEQCKGSTPEEWIQNASNDAAMEMKQTAAEIRRQALEDAVGVAAGMWADKEGDVQLVALVQAIRALAQPNGAEGER